MVPTDPAERAGGTRRERVASDLDPTGLPSLARTSGADLRIEYQAWLDQVDDELVGGGLLIAEAMPHFLRSLLVADRACVDEARALASDVRDRCRRVEEQGFLLLAREAPVAGDLRRLVSLLRLVHDVERSASLMRHVAESCERIDLRLLPGQLRQQIEELGVRSIEVFRRGVDAWRQRDALAVHDLDRMDTDVDTLRTGLLLRARELQGEASDLLMLGLLGRYFERLADHGVAFAQHVTFVVTGDRVEVGT
jgi:phosphate transport system protein